MRRHRVNDLLASEAAGATGLCVQISAAGILHQLIGPAENVALYSKAGLLLKDGLGWLAFKRAVSGKSKHFLAQSVVQRFISREWSGPLLDMLFVESSINHADERCIIVRLNQGHGIPVPLIVALLIPFNLLLLPIITVMPPLEERLFNVLCASKRQRSIPALVHDPPSSMTRHRP